ncbi:hypothetical protein [Mesoplasma tabanidae]|uniref:Uncharacterized protein n=1 Tax=Mesoplasma tabanidae TaxID=219745 RepID=A0A2K8P593_9MOLU|nr:hypothetical protein [Mesoplasma tabanidae]ATZ21866.1 hypothetical protein MTABA_v1c06740 [Mesoplasma tabanidae]
MNIEKIVYNQINKSYQSFKMLDSFLFDNQVKHFLVNNFRIENVAQLEEVIKIVGFCKKYNLIFFQSVLEKLENEFIFYKKTLAAFYKNTENFKTFLNENFEKLFIVSYQENKEYILTSNDIFCQFVKEVVENNANYQIDEKTQILTQLLNYINLNRHKNNFSIHLTFNKQKIITLIELFKII